MTDRELMQQVLNALEQVAEYFNADSTEAKTIIALRKRLVQPDPSAYWHNEFLKHNTTSEQPAQQQEPEPDRVKFERHWRKTRGEKKANRELSRHPLQPQTYIQDSANRHWVTWQAAVRSVAPPASKPWVGLTQEDMYEIGEFKNTHGYVPTGFKRLVAAIEAKLREKNA